MILILQPTKCPKCTKCCISCILFRFSYFDYVILNGYVANQYTHIATGLAMLLVINSDMNENGSVVLRSRLQS